tara:strand:- start:1153 stop:1341 length:189 start_codon:yes stop_codon:yes gene_type:complete
MVETVYDKKDVAAAPKIKAAPKPDFPEGWSYTVKRGSHCVWDPKGNMSKHASKVAAMRFANG